MVVGRNKITFDSSQDWEELGYEKKKEWNAQIYSMKCWMSMPVKIVMLVLHHLLVIQPARDNLQMTSPWLQLWGAAIGWEDPVFCPMVGWAPLSCCKTFHMILVWRHQSFTSISWLKNNFLAVAFFVLFCYPPVQGYIHFSELNPQTEYIF